MTGYAIPAKFQTTGLVGESENRKLDTRVERTISDGRNAQSQNGRSNGEHTRLTHLELRELETTG